MKKEISSIMEEPQKPAFFVEIETSLKGGKPVQELKNFEYPDSTKYPLLEADKHAEHALKIFEGRGSPTYTFSLYTRGANQNVTRYI